MWETDGTSWKDIWNIIKLRKWVDLGSSKVVCDVRQ